VSSNVQIINSNTILFDGFAAQIAEACSGIYSIFIFSSLYILFMLVDWKKMNKLKAGLLFIPAVVGAFLVNILRVFLIMIFGAHVSKTLALGLYHSYSGMILFLIYFAIFWRLSYKWMKK
jgi:exosortase